MKNAIARKVLIPLLGLCILGVGGELIGSAIGAEPAAGARTTGQVLEPEEAFAAQVRSIASDRIAVDFTIAPGHHLYR